MTPLQTGMIEFEGIPGYLCRPESDEPLPSVVIIQEWWGLDDHIKAVTERYAMAGFVTLAPDLYRGVKTTEPDEARKLAMELDHARAIADIQGAVDYLRVQDFVEPKRVGVLGFCMGGGLALAMASAGKHVDACVVFYGGRGAIDDETAANIKAPILGFFGEDDGGFPAELLAKNEAKLKAHDKIVEFHIYPKAGHAFFNDTRAAYDPDASHDAWQKSLAFLQTNLAALGG